MSANTIRGTVFVPSRMATPPPVVGSATRSGATILARAFARHAVTLIAIAFVFVAVAFLDRATMSPGPGAFPLSVIAFAGLGAAAVSMLLRRAGVRHQTPWPGHRAAASPTGVAGAPVEFGPPGARRHERSAAGTWRGSLLRVLMTLSVASLMLALVVRSPHSVPLLLGVGLSGLFALRLLAGPPRGIVGQARPATAGVTRPAGPGVDAERVERPPHGGRLDWAADEVHGAALDSFPASDPPSWSPLRIGAPAAREPHASAPA